MYVVVCDRVHPVFDEIMRERGYTVRRCREPREIVAADIVVVRSGTRIGQDLMSRTRARIVARAGSGIDNIDWKTAMERDIMILTAPVSISIAVAELTLLLILALLRRAREAMNRMEVTDRNRLAGYILHGKRVGIIGAGHVGSRVSALLRAAGCHVVVHDPLHPESVPLEEIYREAEIITYHVPLTDKTREMINLETIRMMKSRPFIINTSRPAIMSISDVRVALERRMIRGLGIDFIVPELAHMPSVIMFPHIGATTVESQEGVARELAGNIIDVLDGKFVAHARTWPSWYLSTVKKALPSQGNVMVPLGPTTVAVAATRVAHAIELAMNGKHGNIYEALGIIEKTVISHEL